MKSTPAIMSSSGIRTNENDVLLGRGGNNHSHCGNEQLRGIAHGRVGEYIVARKKQKAIISRRQEGIPWRLCCRPLLGERRRQVKQKRNDNDGKSIQTVRIVTIK
jgi:hypothetical protein